MTHAHSPNTRTSSKTISGTRARPLALVAAALLGSSIVAGWTAPARAASKDQDAVSARVADFIALFNKGDAKGMAAFWLNDGSLVNPTGMKGTGPAEVEKVMATDIATILKGTKMEMTVTSFRPVGKDAAWVELDHHVTGAVGPDGKTMPPLTFHVPCLMLKKSGTWMIAEARPYAYLPPLPHPAMAANKTASPAPAPANK